MEETKIYNAEDFDDALIAQTLKDVVEILVNNNLLRDDIQDVLKTVYDIERIISKVVTSNVNARELLSLKNSLENLPTLKNVLGKIVNETKNVYYTKNLIHWKIFIL